MLTPESIDMASVKSPFPSSHFYVKMPPTPPHCQKLGFGPHDHIGGWKVIDPDHKEMCDGGFEEELC